MEVTPVFWIAFNAFLLTMLLIDLGVFNRKSHVISFKESLTWVGVWVTLSMVFAFLVYELFGKEKALMYLTGYVIELSLSVDNLFVFILIFSFFSVPAEYQHRVLFWGILGALVMRLIFIFAGAALLERFDWMIYFFGVILVYSGIKMVTEKDKKIDPEKNVIIKFLRRTLPISNQYHGDKFFVRENGKVVATLLFVVLVMIEVTDLVFAVDSVPAILAITTDRFIVYTSNAFAILGLRSLYFALAGVMGLFRYLPYGLSVILVFIGAKMLLHSFVPISVEVSLMVVMGVILISILTSVLIKEKKPANLENPNA
jgi:tellurite resistance protein TerC